MSRRSDFVDIVLDAVKIIIISTIGYILIRILIQSTN